MSKCCYGGVVAGADYASLLATYIGETVTIFTASGGQSGSGFTGVILSVNDCFVRLTTRIGPPPGCALGNSCTNYNVNCGRGGSFSKGFGPGRGAGFDAGPALSGNMSGAAAAGGWNGYPVYTVGSITDIPIRSIVSIVHNAI